MTQKPAYEELEMKVKLLEGLIRNSQLATVQLTVGGVVSDINPSFSRIFGFEPEETVGRHIDSIIAPPERMEEAEGFTARATTGDTIHTITRRLRKNGTPVDVEIFAGPLEGDGEILGAYSQYEDITGRMHMEEALRRRAEELAALQATLLSITTPHELTPLLQEIMERAIMLIKAQSGMLYLCDPERREARCVVSSNTKRDYTGTILRYGEGASGTVALTGEPLNIMDYRTWDNRAAVYEKEKPFTAVLSVPMLWQGRVTGVINVLHDVESRRFTGMDQELLTLFANHAAIAVENTRLYEAARREVADRKRAEDSLKSEKEYLNALHETALGLISRLELDELLEAVITRAARLVGTPDGYIYLYDPQRDDLVLRHALGAYLNGRGLRLKRGEGLSGKVMETGKTILVDDYRTWEGRSSDPLFADLGSTFGIPLKSGGQIGGVLGLGLYKTDRKFTEFEVDVLSRFAELASIALDNARLYSKLKQEFAEHKQTEQERRRLEVQLVQAQRIEAIGTLAGGIAHNFNNLLMGIQGYATLARQDTDSSSPIYRKLENIEKLVMSGSRLTSQLLGYAREGRFDVRPVSLNRLVKETSDTFTVTRKEIAVFQDLAPDLEGIRADQGQIEQVLLNLYVNAADAMPGGGELHLETRNSTHEDLKDRRYEVKPGPYVMVRVRDTGTGMDQKTMKRIFDPFFTTKDTGKGTGLGLASVFGIVKAHGGYIDVFSEKGQGAVFEIYLPAYALEIPEEEKPAEDLVKGGAVILLVDDEDVVIDVGREYLKRLGYRVLVARSGPEAVDVYDRNRGRIAAVILDMIMPQMGGGETFDRLREINPGVSVLLSSGYTIDGRAMEILQRGCRGFLQKPFTLQDLSGKLAEILDSELSKSRKKQGN